MPTEKPRVTFTISKERLSELEAYQHDNKIKNQTQAILSLIERGLSDFEPAARRAPSLPEEALQLARDYAGLDPHGRRVVRLVAEEERARMEDEARLLRDLSPEGEPRIIPLYLFPAAAGYASPVLNTDYEPYELRADDPQGAEFAVRLQGDSMAPDFPDGGTVFCNRDPMADGDIGIFCVDGGTVCKQYHREGGVVYLFSLNRRRADADLVLLPGGNRSLICQGRVITRRSYPVPGRG